MLELGGSDPFVVMPSADMAKAVKTAVTARSQNNGQSCIAAKRFIVHTDVYDEFAEMFVDQMARSRSATRPIRATDVGPLATEQGRADVEELVDRRASPRVPRSLCGGKRPDRTRLVLPADGHRRHHGGHADVRGGGLRAGRLAVPCRRHRRGDRDRERHDVRPRLQRLDQRRRPSRSDSSTTSTPGRSSSTA